MRIGLDIGGTKTAAVLLSDSGRVLADDWREHGVLGQDAVAAELAQAARRLDTGPDIRSVGVSVSGLVRRDGTVTSGATLEIAGDLAGAISRLLPHPVHVFNDADATLRSVIDRHRTETGETVTDAVLLTLGTGIGGAVIAAGRAVRGDSGLAGELGHLPVRLPTDELCVCGSSGCLEQYVGGKGLAVLARRAIHERHTSAMFRELEAKSAKGITAKDIVNAARAGDPTASELMEQAAICCAQAIRAICVTVEPTTVFLGGSVAHGAADFLPARIEHHLRQHWSFPALTTPPRVRLDPIGPYAAAIGAAILASDIDHAGHPQPHPRNPFGRQ